MDLAFISLIYGCVCVCYGVCECVCVCVYRFLGDVWECVGKSNIRVTGCVWGGVQGSGDDEKRPPDTLQISRLTNRKIQLQ